MSSVAAKVVPNALAVVAQIVASALVLFLLYRYLLQVLGPDSLGTWSLVVALVSLARVAEFGVSGSVVRYVSRLESRGRRREAELLVRKALLFAAMSLAAGLLVLYLPVAWAIAYLLPEGARPEADAMLPLAMVVVWVSGIGAVLLGTLDGQSRIRSRAGAVVVGNLVLLGAAGVFVPRFGIRGVVLAQLVQAVLVVGVAATLMQMREREAIQSEPSDEERVGLDRLLAYGVGFQFIALVGILLDPMTKAILGRVDSLAAVAYFEMASKLVLQLRNVIASANQVAIPYIASVSDHSARVLSVYRSSWKVVYAAAIPTCAVVAANVPAISHIWVGDLQPQFCSFAWILLGANAVNALCGPAYVSNLGEGELRWNVIAHGAMALTNALGSAVLGVFYQGIGAVAGYATAVAAGSMILMFAFQARKGIALLSIVGAEDLALAGASIAGLAVALLLYYALETNVPTLVLAGLGTVGFCACVALPLSGHTGTAIVIGKVRNMRSRKQ